MFSKSPFLKLLVYFLSSLFFLNFGCSDNDENTDPVIVIDDNNGENYNPSIEPTNFVVGVNHQFFNLTPGKVWIYEGIDDDGAIEKIQVEVTNDEKFVMGVKTVVLRDRVWIADELVEDTRDWVAQDQDGNVWYFGEDVDNYENGVLHDHEGAWEAGINGAKPGILMKANPQVGDAYRQEFLKNEAEDMAEVLSLSTTVEIGLGNYQNCLQTVDWTPLEADVVENKYYSSEFGNVIYEKKVEGESGYVELTEVQNNAPILVNDNEGENYNPEILPENFVNEINNPYLNLVPGKVWTFEGVNNEGEKERIEFEVTALNKEILGVPITVIRDRIWVENELVEDTRDFYAQDIEGNVWYFGEEVDNYENGVLVNHDGSWEAGKDEAKPGIFMKANPQPGDAYRQEFLQDTAEDLEEVLSASATVETSLGIFKNCVQTMDWSPLNPEVIEVKFYSKEVGGVVYETKLSGEEGFMELIEVKNP